MMSTGIGKPPTLMQWYGERWLDGNVMESVTIDQTSVTVDQWGDMIHIRECICGHTEWQHHNKGCLHRDPKWAHSSAFLKRMHNCQCKEFTLAQYPCADTWDT